MFSVRQVTIFCEEQHQCFEGIWEVVHEKENLEWTLHGALRSTTAHYTPLSRFSLFRSTLHSGSYHLLLTVQVGK